jgi:hypothetical protein
LRFCRSGNFETGHTLWRFGMNLAGVASALGDSSRYLWLKLPHCDGYETVARATTLPILLLGGESAGDPSPFLRQLGLAMAAGPNIRGALVGRNVCTPATKTRWPWPKRRPASCTRIGRYRKHCSRWRRTAGATWIACRVFCEPRNLRRYSLETRRITVAQALVSFLKNQYVDAL